MKEAEKIIRSTDLSLPVSKDQLIAALLPRVGFSSYPWMPRALPLGASRFGGPADLPAGVDWPMVDGRPLLFLGQLNFAQLPIERDHPIVKRLPARGWLCLFLDAEKNACGMAGTDPGVVVFQFDGDAKKLVRHDPEPPPNAETWTHCHAVTVFPADHHLCLPDADAVGSPLPKGAREEDRTSYFNLACDVENLARTQHEVTLLGSPTLFKPDPRRLLPRPKEWLLLLQFDGECSWLAGVADPGNRHLRQSSIGETDYVQYFVRKSDYESGRLDAGFLDYMRT